MNCRRDKGIWRIPHLVFSHGDISALALDLATIGKEIGFILRLTSAILRT